MVKEEANLIVKPIKIFIKLYRVERGNFRGMK